jgi:hypothetical protein
MSDSKAYMPHPIIFVFSDKDFVTAVVSSNGVLATDAVSHILQPDLQTFVDVCSYATVDDGTISAVCAESSVDPTGTGRVDEEINPVSLLTLNAVVS